MIFIKVRMFRAILTLGSESPAIPASDCTSPQRTEDQILGT